MGKYIGEKISINFIQPGFFTTIQDAGRTGYQQYGMPVAGPMDMESYLLGQALVGNRETKGALECTVLPPTIEVFGECIVAFTGANMKPTINGVEVSRYIPYLCHAGDILSGSVTECGMRMYISFSGGIDVPLINGSVSTHTKACIGGCEGRAIQKNDELMLHSFTREALTICEASNTTCRLCNSALYNRGGRYCHEPFRVVLGEQAKRFTKQGIKTFVNHQYRLTDQCDRMGFRLEGPQIEHTNGADIISDGAVFGSIQVPSNGKPIILMADRQTTGGYTKIGTIISADLPRLSQLPVGDIVQFELISIEVAQKIYRSYMAKWEALHHLARRQSRYVFRAS